METLIFKHHIVNIIIPKNTMWDTITYHNHDMEDYIDYHNNYTITSLVNVFLYKVARL